MSGIPIEFQCEVREVLSFEEAKKRGLLPGAAGADEVRCDALCRCNGYRTRCDKTALYDRDGYQVCGTHQRAAEIVCKHWPNRDGPGGRMWCRDPAW